MLDDIRNHDPAPTPEERDWMDADPLDTLMHGLVMVGFAILVGVSAAELASPPGAVPPAVATTA